MKIESIHKKQQSKNRMDMKININIICFLILPFSLLVLLNSCEKRETGCLPYQGEVFAASCNGIVIKVTNTSVNSSMEWGGGLEQNVLTVRIPESIGFEEFFGFPIDESKAHQRFYFDFRELDPEEYNVCTMATAEPTRKVYMTKFSLDKCPD